MMENKIPNSRWMRILPATILIYIAANIDRANISFAMAGGMLEDLNLDPIAAGLALGIFFWGYLILQVPGGDWAEKHSAKHFISVMIVIWGSLATYCGFASTPMEFYIVRFCLGLSEGGIFPAILVIIAHWFPPIERARANSFFIISFPISAIISGPLSGWLIATWGWRDMFIIEGLLSIILLFVWMPMIADRPNTAKWLKPAERNWIESQLQAEIEAKKVEVALNKSATTRSYTQLIIDANIWKLTAIYFFICCAFYVMQFWLPTLIKQVLQVDITMVGWLSTLPNIASLIGILLFGRLCDKSQNRKKYTLIPCIGIGIGLIGSVAFASYAPWLSFAFMCLCGFCWQSAHPAFWSIFPEIFQPEVAGGARGMANAIGNLGGFFAPMIIGLMIQTFSRDTGMYLFGLLMFVACFIIVALPKTLDRGNKA